MSQSITSPFVIQVVVLAHLTCRLQSSFSPYLGKLHFPFYFNYYEQMYASPLKRMETAPAPELTSLNIGRVVRKVFWFTFLLLGQVLSCATWLILFSPWSHALSFSSSRAQTHRPCPEHKKELVPLGTARACPEAAVNLAPHYHNSPTINLEVLIISEESLLLT